MKKLILIILVISSVNSSAWTLSRSARSGFITTTSIDVYIGSDNCPNAGLTADQLLSYTESAVSEFWNKVPTTSLKLNVKGVTSISLAGDTLNTAVNKAPTNSIIIGCNSNATIFTSTNILGVGGMSCGGTDCAGVVVMNDIAGTVLASSDRQTIVATLAHEMGHALGLGHTSVKSALMYYDATGVINKALHQDDIDGISYLYPNKSQLGGFAGSCSAVPPSSQNRNYLFQLLLGFLLIAMARISKIGRFHTKK